MSLKSFQNNLRKTESISGNGNFNLSVIASFTYFQIFSISLFTCFQFILPYDKKYRLYNKK